MISVWHIFTCIYENCMDMLEISVENRDGDNKYQTYHLSIKNSIRNARKGNVFFFHRQLFFIDTWYCRYVNYYQHASFFQDKDPYSWRHGDDTWRNTRDIAWKLRRYRWLSNSGKFTDALIIAAVHGTINGIKRDVKEILALRRTTGGLSKLPSDGVLSASVPRLDGWEMNPLIFLVDTFSRQRSAWLPFIFKISRQDIKFNISI